MLSQLWFLVLWFKKKKSTMTKNKAGKKRCISTDMPTSLSIFKESWSKNSRKAGAWRQELKQWNGRRLLPRLLFLRCQPGFLYSQTTSKGGAPPPLVRAFHFSHHLRKCTTDLPRSKHYRDIFPSSQMCQVNIKLAAKVFLH